MLKDMKITLCGSMVHIDAMIEASKQLQLLGYETEIPNPREGETDYTELPEPERQRLKDQLMREHLHKISDSDAVLIYNEDKKGIEGYVGGNTLMEMAFAFAQKIEIFLLKTPTGVNYTDEIIGMQPIILNSAIDKIDSYFTALPTTYVSSKSPIKLRAISRALRKVGIKTNVLAHPTPSGVNEQPFSIDETYRGAENRHNALKESLKDTPYDYLATVESGLHQVHSDHGLFDCVVSVIETRDGLRKTGITAGVEFPKEMTDKIPSDYPDLGVLVQEEFGSTLKDAIPYVTNRHVTRLSVVENALVIVASQLAENTNG